MAEGAYDPAASNCSVGEALALGTGSDEVGSLQIINAETHAVVIPEVEFRR